MLSLLAQGKEELLGEVGGLGYRGFERFDIGFMLELCKAYGGESTRQ